MNGIPKQVREYYESKLDNYGTGARGVGWKNEATQENRFLQLSRIIIERNNFSINDLGCGTGDLLPYLHSNGFGNFTYHGYDILESMIQLARQKQGNCKGANFTHIDNASEMREADYTVASGIFNLKYNSPENEWLDYVRETISHMNNKSERGFAFNMLTKYSDKEFMEADLYYADPLYIFDYCKLNCSRNVALLHDYYEFDFTLLVRK
jgi:SAM-dependent methyltransferase